MDDIIELGIEAKHSNEDAIAPFGRWIQDYGGQEWVERCVTMAFEAYRDVLGAPCRSFRFDLVLVISSAG